MPTLRNSAQAFSGSATSLTAAGFTTAGSDRLGLVKVGWFATGDISAVTWGGTSIIGNVIENNVHDGSNRKRLLVFYMLNPPTGASDVVVTKAGSATAMSMVVEAWDGVDQTTPWADKVVTTAGGEENANPAIKTSTAASGKIITDVFFMWSAGGAGTSWALGADQTQIQANLRDFGGGSNTGFFGSSYATSDGSVDMTWDTDHAATNRWAMCIISLTAAASGTTYDEAVSEAVSASDSVSSAATLVGALSEAASAAESIASALQSNDQLSEVATAADSVAGLIQAIADAVEAGSAADQTSSLAVLVGALSESASAQDSVSQGGGSTYSMDVAETAAATDAVLAELLAAGAISEAVSGADSVAAQVAAVGAIAEAGSASDSVAALAALIGALSEAAAALDTVAATGVLGVSILEVGTADFVVSAGGILLAPGERVIAVRFADRTVYVDLQGREVRVQLAPRTIN